jgi:hypothetical protein
MGQASIATNEQHLQLAKAMKGTNQNLPLLVVLPRHLRDADVLDAQELRIKTETFGGMGEADSWLQGLSYGENSRGGHCHEHTQSEQQSLAITGRAGGRAATAGSRTRKRISASITSAMSQATPRLPRPARPARACRRCARRAACPRRTASSVGRAFGIASSKGTGFRTRFSKRRSMEEDQMQQRNSIELALNAPPPRAWRSPAAACAATA